MRGTYSLVIFDCDGVLVDTEGPQNRLLAELISREGLPLRAEDCRRLYGGSTMETVQAEVERRIGRALGPNWIQLVIDETVALFERGVDMVAGVEDQIVRVKTAGIDVCVASSGKPEKMRLTLGKTRLDRHFTPHIYDATMVARGKPAPDLFLHAAEQVGHAPQACVVIEDSVPGVRAAVAAGMDVLGFAGTPMADAVALAQEGAHVFDDMRALPDLLRLPVC